MEKVLITEVCDILVGRTPSRYNPVYWGTGFPWLSIADMNQGDSLSSTKETITTEAVKECNCKQIPKGTVLFSFKLSIGKVGITAVDMFTNEAIAAFLIKDKSRLDTKFLFYTLKSTDYSVGSNKAVMGKTLNKEQLKKFTIPLPSIEEQLRIVKILDLAQSLIEKRRQAIAYLDDYIKTVFLDMFGDPVSNPQGWEMKKIEQLVKKDKYSIKRGPFGGALKKEIFVEKGYLVYEQFHALNNDFTFERYFIDEKRFKELIAFEVKTNDIIISCSGIYLGKLAIVPNNSKKGIINQALMKITLDNAKMTNLVFKNIFTDSNFKNKYYGNQIGSGIPNFPPIKEFKKFIFICPPIELQNKFDEIFLKTETLKQKMQTQLKELENNFQAQLQRAFRGD